MRHSGRRHAVPRHLVWLLRTVSRPSPERIPGSAQGTRVPRSRHNRWHRRQPVMYRRESMAYVRCTMGVLPPLSVLPALFLFLFFSEAIRETGPAALLWTAPAILGSALMIAWAAESAQFFMAQGFALAILALLQT